MLLVPDLAGYESELESVATQNGLGVIGYYSLASGFLSGKYRSKADENKSARGQHVVEHYINPRGMKILDALDSVSVAYQVSQAQVALARQRISTYRECNIITAG